MGDRRLEGTPGADHGFRSQPAHQHDSPCTGDSTRRPTWRRSLAVLRGHWLGLRATGQGTHSGGVCKGVSPAGNGGPRLPGRATNIHVLKEPALGMETGPRGPRIGAEGDLNGVGGGWRRFYQGKTHEQMGSSGPSRPGSSGQGSHGKPEESSLAGTDANVWAGDTGWEG